MRKYCLVLLAVGLALLLSISVLAEWGTPVLWEHSGPGQQRMPWLDGDTLYFADDYDIKVSTFDGAKWSEPAPVPGPINTAANEINPCLVQDGKVLYFGRYDPITDYDFYRAEWDEAKGAWSEPELVEAFSSDGQEWDIWVSPDETIAYLTSKGSFGGQESLGGQDIWKSVKKDGEWTTPVNVSGLNTDGNEWSVYVGADGAIYIDGAREGSVGGYDIWKVASETGPVANLGEPINSDAAERSAAFNDKFFIFSASNREGGNGYDLWVAPNESKVTVIQQAPAAEADLPYEISGVLGGELKFQFADKEKWLATDNKWKMYGRLSFIGRPHEDFESSATLRFSNIDNYDETLDIYHIEFEKAHLKYQTEPLTLRWFWNEDVEGFSDPFRLLDAEALADNYDYDDNYFNGLELAAELYGIEAYGLVIPRFNNYADVWGYQLSREFGPVMVRTSFAQYADQPGFQRVQTWHGYDGVLTVTPELTVSAEYAVFDHFWGGSSKTYAEPQKAIYVQADYQKDEWEAAVSYRQIDADFTDDRGYNEVQDRFTPNRKGFEVEASVPVSQRVVVNVGRDQFASLDDTETYVTNIIGGNVEISDTISGNLEIELSDQNGEKSTTTTIGLTESSLGVEGSATFEKANDGEVDTTLTAKLSPITGVTVAAEYKTNTSTFRGQVDWDITTDISGKFVLGFRDAATDNTYRYAKVTRDLGSGTSVWASLGTWDDGALDAADWTGDQNVIAVGGKVSF